MVAYSFQRQFAPFIEAGLDPEIPDDHPGVKRHTIRASRQAPSRHARPGEVVRLWQTQRSPHRRLLGSAECVFVGPIGMRLVRPWRVTVWGLAAGTLRIDERTDEGAVDQLNLFAARDGFPDGWDELLGFWARHHAGVTLFWGVMVGWRPTGRAAPSP